MAGRWAEGFESHRVTTQWDRKYATRSGSFTPVAGRTFGFAGGVQSAQFVTPSLGNDDTWTIGFGVQVVTHSAQLDTDNNGLYFEDGADEQFHIAFFSTNGVGWRIRLYRGTTLIDETGDFDFGVWHYIEVQVGINTTTGTYEVRRNGVQEISGTGANTAANGNTGADVFAFRFVDNLSSVLYLDDMYVVDSTGTKNNDFLGPRIVEAVEVSGNGAQNDWNNTNTGTPDANNYQQVDDVGSSSPDDTGPGGTIDSDTNTDIDLYAMTDLQEITGNIDFVFLGVQAAMSAAGSRTLRFKFRDPDTTVANGDSFVVDSTVFDEFIQVWDDNPASAAAWDVADIDGGQFGVEVVS